jgi:gamma-glutamyl:cysteine ligase YbdK (ATP-grasp superfamily)
MVKRLKRKLKGVEIEITFAEPKEYDTAKGGANVLKKTTKKMKSKMKKAIERLSHLKASKPH